MTTHLITDVCNLMASLLNHSTSQTEQSGVTLQCAILSALSSFGGNIFRELFKGICKNSSVKLHSQIAVADPGFPVGVRGPRRGGCGLLRQLHFVKFVCQNERIGSLRGGARRVRPP